MKALRLLFGWAPEEHLSDTAWLNGVRGLAAFLVMMSHYSMAWLSSFAEAPFGALVLEDVAVTNVWYFRKGQRLWAPWRLPILRIFMCNGGGQVALFFIISGFVLTWAPLAQYDLRSLGSSVFRRWSRLYLPCGIVTFLCLLNEQRKHWEGVLPFFKSCWEYIVYFETWANPFKTVAETIFSRMQGYNLVVWTIPHEFSGSIFVYCLVLAFGRFTHPRRLILIVLVTIYALLSLKWDLWLFGTGMVLAEYTRQTKAFGKTKTWVAVLWSIGLLLGLMLLSYPGWGEKYTRPGYELLDHVPLPMGWRGHVPDDRFWWGLGATLIIGAACHLRIVRRVFKTDVLQHLGKISFMLYLLHLLFGNLMGGPLQDLIYSKACTYVDDPSYGIPICQMSQSLHVAILVSLWAATVPPLLIAAHVLEVLVDRPVTTMGKTIDNWLLRRHTEDAKTSEEMHLLSSSSQETLELNETCERSRV